MFKKCSIIKKFYCYYSFITINKLLINTLLKLKLKLLFSYLS